MSGTLSGDVDLGLGLLALARYNLEPIADYLRQLAAELGVDPRVLRRSWEAACGWGLAHDYREVVTSPIWQALRQRPSATIG